MTIYEFIKEKQLEFLNAKLKMLRDYQSEKDLQQIKDKIFDIEYEDKFHIDGYQKCLSEKITSKEIVKSNIIFNDMYKYNILKNVITKIIPNEEKDIAEVFKVRVFHKHV